VLEQASKIDVVLGGFNPQPPTDKAEKFSLKNVHFFQVNAPHKTHMLVAIIYVIVKFRCKKH
jgi:hypothetical protein